MKDWGDLKLDADDLKTIGVTDRVTLERIVANMVKGQNNARSPMLGSAGEVHFWSLLLDSGAALVEKIADQKADKRYDFEALFEDGSLFTYETKVAAGKGKQFGGARIGFGDSRDVPLPSGKIWKTHARHVSQSFDYLAVSIQKKTGNWSDFYFLPYKSIPHLDVSGKKYEEYHDTDRDWMRTNFLQLSVRVPYELKPPYSNRPRP